MFELFDPHGELSIESRDLPHWNQPGATYFVTFRAADSMPAEAFELWKRQKEDCLKRHGIDPRAADWEARFSDLPTRVRKQFHSEITEHFHAHLDAGVGRCLLALPEIAQIVADSLKHFDGTRYNLGDFVVMPNHVHLIVQPFANHRLGDLCRSWKKYTAQQINQTIGETGHFWQGESFDHLIRNADQFDRIRAYIADNPSKANLSAGQSLYWRRESLAD